MLGETISHYRILEKLGQGGMGEVWLAEDIRLGHKVAIKKLPRELAQDRALRNRFQREAKAIANLRHSAIVPLHEYNEIDGELYLVTEYLAGGSLRDALRSREIDLPVERVVKWGREAAEGLAAAHRSGILHRDIKPDNLLLAETGELRLADFGLAQLEAATRLTADGATLGTLLYLAPEQVRNEPATTQTDLYALGATLYELLAGKPPLTGENQGAITLAILESKPIPIVELRPDVPEHLVSLIDSLLEKDPALRPSSAAEVARRLGSTKIDDIATQRIATPRPRGVRRRLWAIAALALVIGAVWWSQRERPGESRSSLSDRVAIMPFQIRGADEYLREGMVDLLTDKLNGAGPIRTSNKHALLARVNRDFGGIVDQTEAEITARQLDAGFYVLGDVFGATGTIVLSAQLYQVDEPEALAEGRVEGALEDILSLVDQLALQLVSDRIEDTGALATSYESITTDSFDALKWFLQAEREYRSSRLFSRIENRVVEYYRHAIDADSTFSIAWVRLAEAAGWYGGWSMRTAIEKALEHRHALSDHDRLLIEAFALWARGVAGSPAGVDEIGPAPDEAERLYRQVLQTWPDDLEAWLGIARVQIYYNWMRGRNPNEARHALEKALELDPESWIANWLLAWVAYNERAYDEMTELQKIVYGDQPVTPQQRAAYVFGAGTEEEREQFMEELATFRREEIYWSAVNVGYATENFPAAKEIARYMTSSDRPDGERAAAHVILAYLAVAQGRAEEAAGQWAAAKSLDYSHGLANQALAALLPFMQTPADSLARLRRELFAWDTAPETEPRPQERPTIVRVHDGTREILKAYLIASIDLRLGDPGPAWSAPERLDSLATVRESPYEAGWARDLAHSLRAQARWRSGDLDGALEEFRKSRFAARHYWRVIAASLFYFESFDRFLRAELLMEMERYEEALGWYEGFAWCWGYEFIFQAPINRRRGEIFETLGRIDEAREARSMFVQRWSPADPLLQPVVDEVRRRLEPMGR